MAFRVLSTAQLGSMPQSTRHTGGWDPKNPPLWRSEPRGPPSGWEKAQRGERPYWLGPWALHCTTAVVVLGESNVHVEQ